MKKTLRIQAIKRYQKKESPKTIYTDLHRSKNWFFKWLKRFQSGDPNWYQDNSRAPKRRHTAISEIDRQCIWSSKNEHKIKQPLDIALFHRLKGTDTPGLSEAGFHCSSQYSRLPLTGRVFW